ncbi:MAG: class I SAM-dependent methyltransferase [Anaerolineae bacterium]|nr:class I SAM-dependent methyltransferase [Anaerolineae bacterium]
MLEIGVGTGRIAYPVALAGCQVTGFDVSAEMLAQTRASQPSGLSERLRLVRADMQAMPFAARQFDAALAVHVLHLSKDLPTVLAEIARLLRPGAAFIQGDDWIDPESVVGKLRNQLRSLAVQHSPNLMPPSAGRPMAERLAELGATEQHEIQVAEWTLHVSPAERLQQVEQRLDAESWFLPPDLFEKLVGALRAFAQATWSDLETPQPVTRRFILKVSRGSW